MNTSEKQIRELALKGVSRLNVEAVIGHRFDASELTLFRKALAERTLALAAKKERGAKSGAERVRDHVASTNDIPLIDPTPRHPRLKERCKYDLALFGWYYCRELLRHRPSERLRLGLILSIQNAILHGGQHVFSIYRGGGKTTWADHIATVWAILYGHRRFPVGISATAALSRKNLKVIKSTLSRSKAIQQDFPEIAVPIQALGGISQRAASQTHNGEPTDIEWSSDRIVLPMVRLPSGRPMGPGCGAVVSVVGIGGAVRGANEKGQRPDFIIFDDPQTKKIANSPKLVEGVIDYIHQDALQLAGHDRVISAFVTITPQVYGDVACELTSQSKHPEWSVTIEPFFTKLIPNWDSLSREYAAEFIEDALHHDSRFTRSRQWYLDHREAFASCAVVDPQQYDHVNEVDAVHHMLNQRARLGERSFNAEIMMSVADAGSEISITPDVVSQSLNGAPRGICPPGTDSAVAFCDVNIAKGKGLSWAVVAFGAKRVAAVVAYGRYPQNGALVPPNSSDLVRNRLILAAMKQVTTTIANLNLRNPSGRKIPIEALGFDRGYLPDVVHRGLFVIRKTTPLPFRLVAVRSFSWNRFGIRKKDVLRRGDHIFASVSQYGNYLAMMAQYWREIMQSGFLESPLMPGSISLYGRNPNEHFTLANEVCAEKLVRKYLTSRGETAWDYQCTGENHYCDVLTGCLALGSWYHCYDNLASVVDSAAISGQARFKMVTPVAGSRVVQQDDLFDPMKNTAITANAGYDQFADETEGTGDAHVEPFKGDVENTKDPFLEASPLIRRRVIHKPLKPLRKKGRYCK